MSKTNKIVRFLHYLNPNVDGCEYATISERDYPLRPLYRFYTKEKLPKKYFELMASRPCDECLNGIEKWYL